MKNRIGEGFGSRLHFCSGSSLLYLQVVVEGAGATAIEVQPRARVLTELLAEQVDVAVGTATLELVFKDGDLLTLFRKEKIPGTALGRFDRST